MRTKLLAALAAVAGVVGLSTPAAAITNGVPDNGAHPNVGLVGFWDSNGTWLGRCTGTMISPTVLLTAAHCTYGASSARVWFDGHIEPAPGGYPDAGGFTGTPHTNPEYAGRLAVPNTHDVGVVVLDSAPGVGMSQVASVGTLDTLATQRGRQDISFMVVGYGLQDIKPTTIAIRDRLQGIVKLTNLRSHLTDGYNIHHSGAPGTGGGTCFGDSGGPIFSSDGSIVAVTSFGLNANCAGGGFGFRMDTQEVHNFLGQYT